MNSITTAQYQIYLYHNLAVLVDRSCPKYCDEHDAVVRIAKLIAEADKVWAESDKLWAKAHKITAETQKLDTESRKLYAEADKLIAESRKLDTESRKLWAERGKLWAEADKITAEAAQKLKKNPCQCFSIPEEVQRRFDTAAKLRCL